MNPRTRTFLFLGALVASAAISSSPAYAEAKKPDRPPEAGESSCTWCHRDHLEPFGASMHAGAGIACTDCHGGDSAKYEEEAAMYDVPSFRGKPERKDVPELCASCHSDVVRMHAYGLRTDQLALYRSSVHGRKLFVDGDEKVATCIECHESHRVLRARDPDSPVHPSRIAETCGRCHGDAALMAKYGLDSEIPARYAASVHGEAVIGKGDRGAPTCATCHDNHGAIPPGVKEVGAVCGKCHENTRRHFESSPHFAPSMDGKFKECVGCHGNHEVAPAGKTLLVETCLLCHESGSPEAGLGRELLAIVEETEAVEEQARAIVRRAARKGLLVDEEKILLEDARTLAIGSLPVLHTLSKEKMLEVSAKSSGLSRDIIERVDLAERHRSIWRWALVPVWLWILAVAGLLVLKRRRLRRQIEHDWTKAGRT